MGNFITKLGLNKKIIINDSLEVEVVKITPKTVTLKFNGNPEEFKLKLVK